MQPIHETAYPALPAELSVAELKAAFTPTAAEVRFARKQARQASTSVLILVQLKLLQRLGYFPMLADVPVAVIDLMPCVTPRSISARESWFASLENQVRASR